MRKEVMNIVKQAQIKASKILRNKSRKKSTEFFYYGCGKAIL